MEYFDSFKVNEPCVIRLAQAKVRKWRTIEECLHGVHKLDPDTAITLYFIRKLCKDNKVVWTNAGKKILIDFDSLLETLNKGVC